MYVPEHYREARRDVLLAAIEARSFGTLISAASGTIQLTHLPFAISEQDGEIALIGHLARANPHWHGFGDGADVVASFLIDDAYISPSWYPAKQETGRVVPTWNYIAIEVRGPVESVEQPADLRDIVDALTARHERGRAAPWSTGDAPADYMQALMRGIVGFRLRVRSMVGAWKLDQKKRVADRRGAALAVLREGAHETIAHAMLVAVPPPG